MPSSPWGKEMDCNVIHRAGLTEPKPAARLATRNKPATDFIATSVRQSGGQSLGSYRWLIWAIAPVTETAGGENSAFQKFQVIAAHVRVGP